MKKMKVFFHSLKGYRDQNEDAHSIVPNGKKKDKTKSCVNFFGIYDGHGGKSVSEYLSKSLPNKFLDKKVKYPLNKSTVNRICDEIQEELKKTRCAYYSGSTCLALVHFKKYSNVYLNIINVGDSRAVVCENSKAIPLTVDHKPGFPMEKKRIYELGGKIVKDGKDFRVKDLSVSRAFGDLDAQPFVSHRGELFKYKLNKKTKFIIMACDGLWDVMSNQEAVNFVLEHAYDEKFEKITCEKNISKLLANYGLERGSTDNISVIIIFFN